MFTKKKVPLAPFVRELVEHVPADRFAVYGSVPFEKKNFLELSYMIIQEDERLTVAMPDEEDGGQFIVLQLIPIDGVYLPIYDRVSVQGPISYFIALCLYGLRVDDPKLSAL